MSAYIELEDAEEFVTNNIIDTASWDAASDALKEKALNIATNKIDQLNFVGDKTDELQETQFPRGGDVLIPMAIQEACMYLALRLLDDVDPEVEFENQFMTNFQYENIKATYDRSTPAIHVLHGIPSIEAWIRLQPYLRDAKVIKVTRIN